MKQNVLVILIMMYADPAVCGAGLLPQGAGAVQLGYRNYSGVDQKYDSSGKLEPLGAAFDKDFSGTELSAGGNADLQKLVHELKQYDLRSAGGRGLSDTLTLGHLRGDVDVNVEARVFGLAYGLTPSLTLFAGIPWVEAKTHTDLRMEGANNALAIRDELGALAYDDLKTGLERAAALNVAQIKQVIAADGYKSVDDWSSTGFGDLRLGARTGFDLQVMSFLKAEQLFTTTLIAPTGKQDDPDALTDVKFGNGYYGLDVAASERLRLARVGYLGADANYTHNLDASVARRVPEADSAIVAADRRRNVSLDPGDDAGLSALVGVRRMSADLSYKVGTTRHYGDRYHGALPGSYERLSERSDTRAVYQSVTLGYDTIEAFKHHHFVYPFIVALSGNQTMSGRNITPDRFYELSLTGFFAAQ